MKTDTHNMDLWNAFEKTDPKFTKEFKGRGGFSGTAINATSIVKRLTEKFGPCGMGWRFVIDDEKIVEGHKLKSGDVAKLHIIRGHIEYRFAQPLAGAPADAVAFFPASSGWYSTSPQFGQTMLVDENRNGTFTDEEAPKKSVTDCMSKCAVLLGVSADVHLGMFDDNKYVNQRRQEEASGAPPPPHGQPIPDPKPEVPPPTNDETETARSAFTSIKAHIEMAASEEIINQVLAENTRNLLLLETKFPANYRRLQDVVKKRKEDLAAMEIPA